MKRKKPVTSKQPSKRPRQTSVLINSFHAIHKKLALHLDESSQTTLTNEIENLGGLNAYQKASLKGGNEKVGKGACGKWLDTKLFKIWKNRTSTSHCLNCGSSNPVKNSSFDKNQKSKLRILDVGSLTGKTFNFGWMDPSYIDLNPQCEGVQKQDFFDRQIPVNPCLHDDSIPRETFDCVSLSLVVNFVSLPEKRGLMLSKAVSFFPKEVGGFLFVVLPLACVKKSRYLTSVIFEDMMLVECGVEVVEKHFSAKLAFYLFEKKGITETTALDDQKSTISTGKYAKRKVIKNGGGMNNFSITFSTEESISIINE